MKRTKEDTIQIFNVSKPVPYRADVRARTQQDIVWLTGTVVRIANNGTVALFRPDGSEQTVFIFPNDIIDELRFIGEVNQEPPFAVVSSSSAE